MPRVVCSWFPRWPIQRLFAAQPALRKRPLVLFAESAQRLRVTVCCPRAEQYGVRVAQPLADAKAFLTAANYLPAEPEADRIGLQALALDAQQFTPLVGLEDAAEPESLLWDISGCPVLWGDERAFLQAIIDYWKSRGLIVRLAMADTLGTAWAVAHYGPAASLVPSGRDAAVLENLLVAALRLPEATITKLRKLGLHRIRDVLRLPRESLPARFGQDLLVRLDQALGRREELFVAERLREPLVASRDWEYPVTDQFGVTHANRELIRELLAKVAVHSVGLQEVCGEFHSEAGVIAIELRLVEPSNDERHWLELIALRMERQAWTGGITKITWTALRLGTLPQQQGTLFGDTDGANTDRELAALVDRLTSRLGPESVLHVQVKADPQPECAVELIPWGKPTDLHSPAFDSELWRNRPTRLLSPPEPLEVMSVVPDGPPLRMRWHGQNHRVARHWGPERIETGWWRTEDAQRDYYRVEWDDGCHAWTFRDRRDGGWWLHGFFD